MFNTLFHHLVEITTDGGGEVSPNAGTNPQTVSEWAKDKLKFEADKIQESVLNHDAHRLILCSARQWGKTTIVAIKAPHTAITN